MTPTTWAITTTVAIALCLAAHARRREWWLDYAVLLACGDRMMAASGATW